MWWFPALAAVACGAESLKGFAVGRGAGAILTAVITLFISVALASVAALIYLREVARRDS